MDPHEQYDEENSRHRYEIPQASQWNYLKSQNKNEVTRKKSTIGVESIPQQKEKKQLQWFGHLQKINDNHC